MSSHFRTICFDLFLTEQTIFSTCFRAHKHEKGVPRLRTPHCFFIAVFSFRQRRISEDIFVSEMILFNQVSNYLSESSSLATAPIPIIQSAQPHLFQEEQPLPPALVSGAPST